MPATKPQSPRHLAAKYKWKEQWLNEAMTPIRRLFYAAGYEVPEHVRISTGWPSKGGMAKQPTIGQAYATSCSADGSHEIIISVYLDDPVDVLATLIHEVAHVTVGVKHGHRKPFSDCAAAVGLEKPWTATTPSADLRQTLEQWAKDLGQYPHAKLSGSQKKKQSTRLLKFQCPSCECIVRTTARWADTYGEFPCPCGDSLVEAK